MNMFDVESTEEYHRYHTKWHKNWRDYQRETKEINTKIEWEKRMESTYDNLKTFINSLNLRLYIRIKRKFFHYKEFKYKIFITRNKKLIKSKLHKIITRALSVTGRAYSSDV